jgi:hypothetical protein
MTLEFVLRLLAAFACGVVIDLEHQMRRRTAGLRTITLVASGACLFVTLGVLTGNGTAGLTQIASYVVSGVGFLGGGVIIMRDKGSIKASTRPPRSGVQRQSASCAVQETVVLYRRFAMVSRSGKWPRGVLGSAIPKARIEMRTFSMTIETPCREQRRAVPVHSHAYSKRYAQSLGKIF